VALLSASMSAASCIGGVRIGPFTPASNASAAVSRAGSCPSLTDAPVRVKSVLGGLHHEDGLVTAS